MRFVPIDLMIQRVEKYSNYDSELFTELLYAGEFIVKMTVAAFVQQDARARGDYASYRFAGLKTASALRGENYPDGVERAAVFKPSARLMEGSPSSASATDLSRLAWLHLHAGDQRRALDMAELGLQRDQDHMYCQNLVDKLS
jgi:hypothetical protein